MNQKLAREYINEQLMDMVINYDLMHKTMQNRG